MFYKKITIILFGPFFFSSLFFFFFFFFFSLYEMSKLGVRPIRHCGLIPGKYGTHNVVGITKANRPIKVIPRLNKIKCLFIMLNYNGKIKK